MSSYKLLSPIDISSSSVTGQINLYEAGSSFAVQLKTPALAANIDFTLPSVVGSTGKYLQSTNTNAIEWINPNSGTSLPIELSLTYNNIPAVIPISVTSPTLVSVIYFMYNGSILSNIPTDLTFIYSSDGLGALRLKILDITNSSNVIADSGSFTITTGITFSTISTFTNVPTSQALFAVTASAAAGFFKLYSINFS